MNTLLFHSEHLCDFLPLIVMYCAKLVQRCNRCSALYCSLNYMLSFCRALYVIHLCKYRQRNSIVFVVVLHSLTKMWSFCVVPHPCWVWVSCQNARDYRHSASGLSWGNIYLLSSLLILLYAHRQQLAIAIAIYICLLVLVTHSIIGTSRGTLHGEYKHLLILLIYVPCILRNVPLMMLDDSCWLSLL